MYVCGCMCACACAGPKEANRGQWLSWAGVSGYCELSNLLIRNWTQTLWKSSLFSHLLSQSFPEHILFIINIIIFCMCIWYVWGQHFRAVYFLSSLHVFQGLSGLHAKCQLWTTFFWLCLMSVVSVKQWKTVVERFMASNSLLRIWKENMESKVFCLGLMNILVKCLFLLTLS